MSTRAIYRHVVHTIRHAPEGGITYEAFCVTGGCEAESGPHPEQEAAQDWALRHTGRTGHDLFRRVFTDHAKVTRAEWNHHRQPEQDPQPAGHRTGLAAQPNAQPTAGAYRRSGMRPNFLYVFKATRWRGSRAARPPTRPALGSATAGRPATRPRRNA